MVIANFAALLNDDDVWDNPDRFWPERFIGCDGKLIVPDEYLPFGYGNSGNHAFKPKEKCIILKINVVFFLGKHRCMGQTLARSNIFLFSACLLQNFNFSVPDGQAPPSTLGVDGVTPSPGEFNAYVSLRT